MTAHAPDPHHDWHSRAYVDEWLGRDVTRDKERRSTLRRLLTELPVDPAQVERVLDVGGGYGLFTKEALEVFPRARVVLHDFSEPMLERARTYLADDAGRVEFHVADLRDRDWLAGVEVPFDVAISSLAIHNVRSATTIAAIDADVARAVASGGVFLDVDIVAADAGDDGERAGLTLDGRIAALLAAGFASATPVWQDGHVTAMLAVR